MTPMDGGSRHAQAVAMAVPGSTFIRIDNCVFTPLRIFPMQGLQAALGTNTELTHCGAVPGVDQSAALWQRMPQQATVVIGNEGFPVAEWWGVLPSRP